MKAQASMASTPELCAQEVMETVPLVMHFIRTEMRSRRAPSLSVPQFRVLTFLSRKPGAPLTSITEHPGVIRSTASALVDRLVRHQLVSRTEDPQERRCVMLTLTPMGQPFQGATKLPFRFMSNLAVEPCPGGELWSRFGRVFFSPRELF